MILLGLFNILSLEALMYFSMLCTSTCTQSSSPIRPLPLSHLCKYRQSTSALGWCTSYIVILFSNLTLQVPSLSNLISSSYLTRETALELIRYISGFSDVLFLYLTFRLFMVYTIGLQKFKIILFTFLNILDRLSVRHAYSFTFNYYSSFYDQHSTLR